MTTSVTGLTAERMLEIEAACIVAGAVDLSGELTLTKHDGSTIDAGNIKGPQGDTGATGANGSDAENGLPLALTGATAATRYVGATTSGAPTTGTFAKGDFVIDQTGVVWVCTTAGSSGTWTHLVSQGLGYNAWMNNNASYGAIAYSPPTSLYSGGLPITIRHAGAYMRILGEVSCYAGAIGDVVNMNYNIDAGGWIASRGFYFNAASSHTAIGAMLVFAGPFSAGVHKVEFGLSAVAGTGTIQMDSNDFATLEIQELP